MLYSTDVLSIFISYLMVKKTNYNNITGNQKNTDKKGLKHEWYISHISTIP